MKRLIFILFTLFLGILCTYLLEGNSPGSSNIAGAVFFGSILAIPIFWILNSFNLAPKADFSGKTNIDFLFDNSDGTSIFVALSIIFSACLGFYDLELTFFSIIFCYLFQDLIKWLLNYIFYAKV